MASFPFYCEAARRCFLPVGETGVCKRKGASRGTRLHGDKRSAGVGSWGGSPLQCAEGLAPKPCEAGQAASAANTPLREGWSPEGPRRALQRLGERSEYSPTP